MNDFEGVDAEGGESAKSEIVPGSKVETALAVLGKTSAGNLVKAVSSLCTALTDIPVAWLEGFAARERANTAGQVLISKTTAQRISNELEVPETYVEAAMHKAALKMIGQRRNVEKAFEVAVQELAVPTIDSGTSSQVVDEISDDWLNEFESLAAKMSTEKMQNLFGKILAGEIRKPKSFSVRTITLMAQLDNDAAELFLRLCSMAVALKTPSETLDVRVLTLGGSAGQNDLAKYGLAFNKLTLLEEYGLIISDYNSGVDYRGCVPSGNTIHACIEHQGVRHVLLPRPERVGTEVRFPGVALTRAAVELFSIVTQVPFPEYTEAMEKYFQQHGFDLGIVP